MSNVREKGPQIPAIRFTGYTDVWEQRQLKEVMELENGYAYKSEYFSNISTKFIVLTPGNVHIGGGFKPGKGHFYQESGPIENEYIFHSGDMFITMTDLTPSAQSLGYPAIVPLNSITYLHNQRLGKIHGIKGDKTFLYYLLTTSNYHKYIVSTASGTTVKHSSKEKILQYSSIIPNRAEQVYVGRLFLKLDNLIAANERKGEALQKLKKALLQQMFVSGDELRPRVLITEFADTWEKRKLSELGVLERGKSKHRPRNDAILYGSSYPFIQTSDIANANLYISAYSKMYNEIGLQQSKLWKKGTLVITIAGNIADSGILAINACFPDSIIGFTSTKSDMLFVKYSLDCLNSDLKRKASVGTQPNLNLSKLRNQELKIPNIKEQKLVGHLFSKLDSLIAANARKTQLLEEYKKALMQKMFV